MSSLLLNRKRDRPYEASSKADWSDVILNSTLTFTCNKINARAISEKARAISKMRVDLFLFNVHFRKMRVDLFLFNVHLFFIQRAFSENAR